MSNAFVGQNGYYFIYNGCPIGYSWSGTWAGSRPNIIIKRTSGYAQRPAIAVKDPHHMLTVETPESVNDALAFSSPYYYSGTEWDPVDCWPLRVSSGTASPELEYAVYYNYEPMAHEYMYLRTPLVPGGYYDLTNGGCGYGNGETIPTQHGVSEVVRYEQPTGESAVATLNLSDYSAVRNFYAPELGQVTAMASNQYTSPIPIADGGSANNSAIRSYPTASTIKELENFYAPKMRDLSEGWDAVTALKNVNVGQWWNEYKGQIGYITVVTSAVRVIEDVTGTMYLDNTQGPITSATVDGDCRWLFVNHMRNQYVGSNVTFNNCTIGYNKPTTLSFRYNNLRNQGSGLAYSGTYENLPIGAKQAIFNNCDVNPSTILRLYDDRTEVEPYNPSGGYRPPIM